ncbi:DNA-binding transcriptional regulator, AcrR family [Amycolatopsis tolypomycina]|uniref:DNA-binding transcriptional regulator, AcrR family n=1 Tax=Amycolatopsis tolypomycina TaxID=208445 RepID=A0A1H4JGV0_9PSEU|nr:TetR/AcrR family transcriptional regulator [Amycolatopsis tolypomycina]SEB45275.1 DNA-binding transcriptional regulator, AcrR family [Amycolatopsis tolypomycina]
MGSREEIVAAAAKVMREQGYAHATTKVIAQTAGYSEAMLYKHFRDKTDLFRSVLAEELPALGATLAELTADPGRAPLRDNLVRVARVSLAFYVDSFPIAVSMFSSRELLRSHRERLHGHGPRLPLKGVADYLRAERELGRIKPDTDVEAAAALLLGACFQLAFLATFEEAEPADHAERLADTLLAAM